MIDTKKHPCFSTEAKHKFARVHLPVAPKCNIQCNYCNRKFDCVNESRPGVTSAVLSPWQALDYLKDLHKKLPNISVVGIAGPGDPFANPDETMETLRLVRKEYPEMILCVSTNGLNLAPYVDELAELQVSHVTITMNSLDPELLGKIYSWVRYKKRVLRGTEAGQTILEQQLQNIKNLKDKGITVKINSIILPGYNEKQIGTLAKEVAERGADMMNCIPVVQNDGAVFSDIQEPSKELTALIRRETSQHLKPMLHCARCRADAAGLLGKDIEGTASMLRKASEKPLKPEENRTKVAVATHEGLLVNQHLGEARLLYIFEKTRNGYKLLEQRETPETGSGDFRWMELAKKLSDCRALLAGGVGPKPRTILNNSGVQVLQMTGLIDDGLDSVYNGTALRTLKKDDMFKCGDGCRGNAQGCA